MKYKEEYIKREVLVAVPKKWGEMFWTHVEDHAVV